jgi:hypothetical protein
VTLEMRGGFSDRVTVTATKIGTADIQTTGVAVTVLEANRRRSTGVRWRQT